MEIYELLFQITTRRRRDKNKLFVSIKVHQRLDLVNLDLMNELNLVNKKGLLTKFTKSSFGCMYI